MLGKWLVIGGTVLASLICGTIENASANWQCPVGVEPGGPNNSGIACVWIEEPQQPQYDPGPAPDPGPRVPTMYANSYVAVAWHNNADDVWAIWNHRTEAKAKQSALNACNQVMGSGCTIAVSSWNTSVAIARRQNGQIWYATESSPKKARKLVMKSCEEAKNDCKLLHTFTAEPLIQPANFTPEQQEFLETNPVFDYSKKYFPSNVKRIATEPVSTGPQADTSRGFLAIAWTGLSPQAWPNLVVASGYPTVKEAEKVAIARCQAESKQTCSSFGVVDDRTNPMFAAYIYGKNQAYWYSNTTEKNLEKDAEQHCREGNVTCQKIGVFDARRPGVSIHPMKQ
jgi:Domain of unknown function (DUF4189)